KMTLNIGIIGASIAGLACAIELQRLGAGVTVFEKSGNNAAQNGAGMMLPQELVQTLIDRNLLSNNFQGISVTDFSTLIADQNKQQVFLTDTPTKGMCVHWKTLRDGLLEHFDQSCCHYNFTVTQINNRESQTELVVNNTDTFAFDFVICADGYYSLGRRTVFPEIQPEFANYIAWRGVAELDEQTMTELVGHRYNNECYRYLYEGGHIIIYPIPASGAGTGIRHAINWVLYESLATELAKPQPDIHAALLHWNEKQHRHAKELFPLSREFGKLLVTDVPDLTTLTKERMDQLWQETVRKYTWGISRCKRESTHAADELPLNMAIGLPLAMPSFESAIHLRVRPCQPRCQNPIRHKGKNKRRLICLYYNLIRLRWGRNTHRDWSRPSLDQMAELAYRLHRIQHASRRVSPVRQADL
ncbi:unnamed protein product, partial [Sphagnum balticum]